MTRDDCSRESIFRAALVVLVLSGCGSVTPLSDGGPSAGAGGSSPGTGGAAGQTGGAGDQGTAGSGGSGGTGSGGVAGGGHSGSDAGLAGDGGVGDGGTKDGPANACALVATVDRSCAVDADCLAVSHTTSCCGSAVWIGIRSPEKERFASLESACDRTYPACGCAAGPPLTDDGSIISFGGTAGVSCQAGTCKTFSKACGHPCDAGRSCTTCMTQGATATSVCSLQCTKDTMCTESNRTKCQFVFSTGVCVDPTMACSSL